MPHISGDCRDWHLSKLTSCEQAKTRSTVAKLLTHCHMCSKLKRYAWQAFTLPLFFLDQVAALADVELSVVWCDYRLLKPQSHTSAQLLVYLCEAIAPHHLRRNPTKRVGHEGLSDAQDVDRRSLLGD